MELVPQALYQEIATVISAARSKVRAAVNTEMVGMYWQIGRIIVEQEQKGEKRAEYGKAVLKSLSERLTADFGQGFDSSNLRNMRRFYMAFPICDALRHELSWTHYRLLLKVENAESRTWYVEEAAKEGWSTRALERQIATRYYERLLSSSEPAPVRREAAAETEKLTPHDILKDPYVLEFLELAERPSYTECELETELLAHLQDFLLELGKGFSFVARQKRITLEGEHFHLDLVFYNYLLKCFVLIDLKLGKLTHQDIGQMDTYVRMYEEQHRSSDDNPTIGLILCTEKNEAVARYSVLADGKQIFASKYQLVLPTEEELALQLRREIKELGDGDNCPI